MKASEAGRGSGRGRERPPRGAARRLHWIDAVVVAVLAAAVVAVALRLETRLHYDWNWGAVIPDYVLRYDEESGRRVPNLLARGFFTTLRLALWGSLIAALIGVVMGLCRVSNVLFLRLLSRAYVELIRNLPPLVFIFVFFFFLSNRIMPLFDVDAFLRDGSPVSLGIVSALFGAPELLANFVSGLIVLAMFEGAFVTEIVRAGIQSIPRGQWEAGRALGLGRGHVIRDLVLPQALRKVYPPLAGQFINVVKDSSLISLISIQELTFSAVEVAVSTGRVFEVWLSVALMYFAICFLFSLAFRRLERLASRARG